jgi:predicted nucleic acid-binding protein
MVRQGGRPPEGRRADHALYLRPRPPRGARKADTADGALKQRFEATFSHYETLELNAEVYTMAAELRARHGWRTPDAIHAATAIIHSVDEFWTNDLRLDGKDSRLVVRVVT